MSSTESPLRYPGGKTQLAPYVIELLRANDLFYGAYSEPFAGGAGIAWRLLLNGYVSHVYINDYDRSIYAFWASVLRQTDALCERIESTRVTMKQWHLQREIQNDSRAKILDLGFSTLFLNRTNRSGILKGGVIGGLEQTGDYLLDCRFNKVELIRRIRRIADVRDQVTLTRMDGCDYLARRAPKMPARTLINLDPPYFSMGPRLYCSFYKLEDHKRLATAVGRLKHRWMVTYDNAPEIRAMYAKYTLRTKELLYAAQEKRTGVELMVLDPRLRSPAGKRVSLQEAKFSRTKRETMGLTEGEVRSAVA